MNKIEITLLPGATHRDERVAELLRNIAEDYMNWDEDYILEWENYFKEKQDERL